MRRFRIKQVGDKFIPQMWRLWCPYWASLQTTRTGYDWTVCQFNCLEDAKIAMALHSSKPKMPAVIYHYYSV